MTTLEKSDTQVVQCSRCVLDSTDDPNIHFDHDGICNYCREYDSLPKYDFSKGDSAKQERELLIEKIKESGKGKKYDCLIGVSGGVDSTFMALKIKEYGLRPLAFHFDNGWNSELAVKNIENIVTKLDIDLHTYVVNWEEFKDLQLSFIRASVIDIEALTDHGAYAEHLRLASKHRIKYILSGNNIATEAILPSNWTFKDYKNIKDIHRKFGTMPMKTFPHISFFERLFRLNVGGLETVQILNYFPYNKKDAKREITEKLEWRDYGGKHYESIFTRFYQGYILPTKFKVDKRKAHLSNLICSGQITKEEALEELQEPMYDPELLKEDKEFVLKKLNLSAEEFDKIMAEDPVPHTHFDHRKSFFEEYPFLKFLRPVYKWMKNY